MKKKYKLTDETIFIVRNGAEITLHRIQALRDFGDIKAGDLGGYIESEANLSHEGNCWVFDNAKVFGSAKVGGKAEVYGFSEVYGDAWIFGNAKVYGSAKVFGGSVLGV